MKRQLVLLCTVGLLVSGRPVLWADDGPPWSARVQTVLEVTRPLSASRGDRLPLYLWPAMNPGPLTDEQAERLVRQLAERGVGLICSWDPRHFDRSLQQALTVARVQRRLGLRVNVNATACLSRFFDGDPQTAHVDAKGQPFWDESFDVRGRPHHMGCPFTLEPKAKEIRQRVESFVQAYQKAGLPVDFAFVDWEIDGPIDVNGAHAAAQRCVRCRRNIPDVDNFLAFQKTVREMRARLQRRVLAEPLREAFPKVLVGNYAVYPHDGFRYWYDYFEQTAEKQPGLTDQRAHYRHWANEFPLTGYTCAMPVVYTWYRNFDWYDFDDPDYRWFYNLLLIGSSVGQHTPPDVPIVAFVHWHTTAPPPQPDPHVQQFSERAYRELLWHLLLRGTDTFFLWCKKDEDAKEVRLVHQVYAAAQEYGEFLEKGVPVVFDVPRRPAPVVSALRLGNRLLVRRTDFGPPTGPVELTVAGRRVSVPSAPGRMQVLQLPTDDGERR